MTIALAWSFPASAYRDGLLLVIYVIVAFSVLVQGLIVGRLTRRVGART